MQTNPITVRDANPGDLDTVWEFIQKKAAFDNWLDRLTATPQALSDAMFGQPPQMGILLAELDLKVVGFASYFFTFSTYLCRRCVWLDDLYVDEGARRRGVGTELLRTLAKKAHQEGYPRIEWVTAAANATAINFYERIGATVRQNSRVCRLEEMAIAAIADGLVS